MHDEEVRPGPMSETPKSKAKHKNFLGLLGATNVFRSEDNMGIFEFQQSQSLKALQEIGRSENMESMR